MARYTGFPTTCTITNSAGSSVTQSLGGGAASVLDALNVKDTKYLRINAATTASNTALVEFAASALPSITSTKKQSRWLRCVVRIRAISATTLVGTMRFRCGTDINVTADINLSSLVAATVYTFVFPINGSNGGSQYWTGNTSDVKLSLVGVRATAGTISIDFDYIRFEYGEADAYVDVDATAQTTHNITGVSTANWTNPHLSLTPDTDGASFAPASGVSYSLDRSFSALSIPGTYQGMEVWDSFTPNQFESLTLDLAHWPLSVPSTATPAYEMLWSRTRNNRPPISVTPAGGHATSTAVMGYWVWGGGPGDSFTDTDFGQVLNGWAGITEARLTTGGLAPCEAVVLQSSVSTATYLNRVFYRIFYDIIPGSDALLYCDV